MFHLVIFNVLLCLPMSFKLFTEFLPQTNDMDLKPTPGRGFPGPQLVKQHPSVAALRQEGSIVTSSSPTSESGGPSSRTGSPHQNHHHHHRHVTTTATEMAARSPAPSSKTSLPVTVAANVVQQMRHSPVSPAAAVAPASGFI